MFAIWLLALQVAAAPAAALAPGAAYDPKIPTIKQVLGHDYGEKITTPEEIPIYLRALNQAAPDRTRLTEYARSWEGRPLWLFVIASPARLAALDSVKADLRRLADPRGLADADADRLVRTLPAVTWLMHGVHGERDLVVRRGPRRGLSPARRAERSRRRARAPRVDRRHRSDAEPGRPGALHRQQPARRRRPRRIRTRWPPSTTSRGPAAAPTTTCST